MTLTTKRSVLRMAISVTLKELLPQIVYTGPTNSLTCIDYCKDAAYMDADFPRSTERLQVTRCWAISVTAGFLICWTPFTVVTSMRVYSDYGYSWTAAKSMTAELMLHVNSLTNVRWEMACYPLPPPTYRRYNVMQTP